MSPFRCGRMLRVVRPGHKAPVTDQAALNGKRAPPGRSKCLGAADENSPHVWSGTIHRLAVPRRNDSGRAGATAAAHPRRHGRPRGCPSRRARPGAGRPADPAAGVRGRPAFVLMMRKRSRPSVILSRDWSSLQELPVALELVEPVLGLLAMVDLEGHPPLAPVVVPHDLAVTGLDQGLDLGDHPIAPLVGSVRVDHEHEVVEARHRAGHDSSGNAAPRGRGARITLRHLA